MLKLRLSRGDKVFIDDIVEVTLHSHTANKVELRIDAPLSIDVHTVFADKSQQDKNMRKASQLSPEAQQRAKARELSRGGRK